MKLIDICEFIVDCPHSTAVDAGVGYPLIRTPNIGKGRFLLDGVHRVGETAYNARNARAVPQDHDLILAREAPAGNIAIIKNGLKVCLGQRTVLIRPNKDKVVPDFLLYYLLAPQQQHNLLRAANGATVSHVNMPIIRNLDITLPDITEQDKIASILSAYDDLIENNRRRIRLLEESARHLYEEWFARFRFPGHERVRIVDGVPEGWERKKLGALCSEIKDRILPQQITNKIPYIGLEHIPRRSITLNTWGKAEDVSSTKHIFKKNDILFGKIRPYFHKVGVAFIDGLTSADTIVLRPKTVELLPLVLLASSSDKFVASTSKSVKEGSKMPRADWNVMQTHPVFIPLKSVTIQFNEFIFSVLNQLGMLSFAIQKLQISRDLLLPKLMSGEVAA